MVWTSSASCSQQTLIPVDHADVAVKAAIAPVDQVAELFLNRDLVSKRNDIDLYI